MDLKAKITNEKEGSQETMDDDLSENDLLDYEDSDFDYDLDDLELKDLENDTLQEDTKVLKNYAKTLVSKKGVVSDNHCKTLVPTSAQKELEDEEDDIGSEEERDILKGIRDDIENKVRGEMKDELQTYKLQLKALEDGEFPKVPTNGTEGESVTNEEEMDPKLKEAFDKMHKLDRILQKKVRKETQVKRDRILLERRMREEISNMKMGATHYREIKINTERFLALEPPPSHNEGVRVDEEDEEDEEEELPPLFQTQVDDIGDSQRSKTKWNEDGDQNEDATVGSSRPESTTSSQGGSTRAGSKVKGDRKRKKDFIRRNKELAAAAGDTIAMTDDEKKRVKDLLGGIDDLADVEEGDENESTMSFTMDQLALNLGDGFMPGTVEHASLTDIDNKLKSIMPEEDFNTISGHGSSMSKRTTVRKNLATTESSKP